MEGIRKLIRVLEVLFYAIIEGMFAFIFYGMLITMLSSNEELSDALFGWRAECIYCIIVLLFVVRNAIHRIKWYVCTHPTKVQCSHCHSISKVKRYGDDKCLNEPLTILIPRKIRFFNIRSDKIPFFEMALRPYLQLECPECGKKQIICPYCHEPIPQESVKCEYDKASRCPHCGKKIYTPVPLHKCKDNLL